jgi:hypothetical protein
VLGLELLLDAVADRLGDGELPAGSWEQLREANGYLRTACGRARRWLSLTAASRVSGPEIMTARTALKQIGGSWAALLARAVAESLDRRLEEVVPALAERFSCSVQGDCDRCGSVLTEYRGESAVGPAVPLSWSNCPACGLRDATWGAGTGLRISVPRQWARGGALNLALQPGTPASPGWTCASLRDKARGVRVFEWGLCEGLPERLRIPAPAGLSPDLHTLRVARVDERSFSIHRRRVPYAT